MNSMIMLFLLYGAAIISMSVWFRRHRTGDEYLMANREASAFLVGAALFTLVGGGELVAMPALAYSYGFSAIALFLGYALGFTFLGFISPRIRVQLAEHLHLSLPDYVHVHFGRFAGTLTFLISFAAFFALLLIQFTAGGQILNALSSISYTTSVLLTAGIATTYLFIGGFRTVLATDVVQGFARLLLVPLIAFVAAKGLGHATIVRSVDSLPIATWLSLTVTGFFTAASSADVWQRIYAAKSNQSAKYGLFGGGFMLLVFGGFLVSLGIVARQSASITSPDSAFTQTLSQLLPFWAVLLAVVFVLSTIMSTADTELFLLSGMLHREMIRIRGANTPLAIAAKESVWETRLLMVLIAGVAMSLSFIFRELVSIYTWLLSTILVMAPMIIASLFLPKQRLSAVLSLTCNLIIFVILAILGRLTPDNAYYIVLPGAFIYVVTYFVARNRGKAAVA
jgi:solute:Na+ symporter, SSS family